MPNRWGGPDVTFTEFNVGDDGFVSNAAWNDATVELLETGEPRKSETYQLGFNANWILDEITLNFDAAISEAKNEDDGQSNLVVVRAGVDSASINFKNGMSIPDISLSQPLDENAVYGAHHTRQFGDTIEDKTTRFVVDGVWEPSDGILSAVYFGAGYNSQDKDRQNFYPNSPSKFALDHMDEVNPTFDAPTVDISGKTMWQLPSDVIIPGSSENFGDGANVPGVWPSIDKQNLLSYFQTLDPVAYQELLPELNATRGNTYGVKEETLHAYVEAKIEDELFGLPYMIDIGVRYVQTDITSFGYSQNPVNIEFNTDGSLANENWKERSFVSFDGDYSEVLPSMNFKVNLTDDLVVRLAAAQAISRPFLKDLTPNTNIEAELEVGGDDRGNRTISENNPGLSPYSSNQFDTSIEWYYSDNGNLAFATFFKKFEGETKDVVSVEEVAGQSFSVTREYNDDEQHAIIRGYEISWYQTFDEFLPANLEGFGISANFTYNNSESGETDSEGDEIPFYGLSEQQANVNAFYEIEGFSFNVAYNYRSEYTVDTVRHWTYETGGFVNTEQAIAPSWGSLSVGLSYDFNENLQFTADAFNLLDPEENQVINALQTELLTAGASNTQYNWATSSYGRSYSLGMRYKF
jgi:TonB-dependent receptor